MALLLSTHHPDHALHLADRVVLLGRSGVRTGAAAELLTDAQLSALYGVRVSTVAYSDDGDGFPSSTPRRSIVVHYGS
jgi:iron complex transport system ATP-binding protein